MNILVERLSLLKDIEQNLKMERTFYVRQRDWTKVADIKYRLKVCGEKLAVTRHMIGGNSPRRMRLGRSGSKEPLLCERSRIGRLLFQRRLA